MDARSLRDRPDLAAPPLFDTRREIRIGACTRPPNSAIVCAVACRWEWLRASWQTRRSGFGEAVAVVGSTGRDAPRFGRIGSAMRPHLTPSRHAAAAAISTIVTA